jgi:disulfide bond formation protein DsbB
MAVIAVGVAFLAGALHSPRGGGRLVYAGLALLAAAAGGGVAAHHVWLQSLPADQVPACGPGFDYMMDAFPLSQALRMIFAGSGECAEIDWTLFGLSMPAWTLIGFVVLALWAVWTAMRRSPSAH